MGQHVWHGMHPGEENLHRLFCFPYIRYLVYELFFLLLNPFYE